MNVGPSDYRALIGGGVEILVTRLRSRRQAPPADPNAPPRFNALEQKLNALVRRYHMSADEGQTLQQAESSFADWLASRKKRTQAENALEMLQQYLMLDQDSSQSEVIEQFRWSKVRLGSHVISVRRDLLFFGDPSHHLRTISWRREEPDESDLPYLLAPAVLAVDMDLGIGRLGEASYWHMRSPEISEFNADDCRGLESVIIERLDLAERALGRGSD